MIFGRRTHSAIGLDVGPRAIAAAQLAFGRDRWRLHAAAIIDRAPGSGTAVNPTEAQRVMHVLARHGFIGRNVVTAVPDQRLIAAVLELPPRSSGAPLGDLARMEVARANRLEVSAFECASWDVPGPARAADGSHMLAVACRHRDADEIVDGVEAAGLCVKALDVRSWAIARACQRVLEPGETVAAVLDLGESAALLTVVHDGVPAYERILADGALDHLRVAVRSRLGIEPELADHLYAGLSLLPQGEESAGAGGEAAGAALEHFENLAGELCTAIAYAEHRLGAEIRRVHLQGHGAGISGIDAHLTQFLPAPARILRPADVLEMPQSASAAAASPALMTAVGLAMNPEGCS
jgi:type IV pilus assembly protein PilM